MSIDRQSLSHWLQSYVNAWETYDAQAIGDLFSAEATYAWHPWDQADDVARGREQIVKAWLGNRDIPGTYQAQYAPLAIDGDQALATGQTRYFDASGQLERHYHNLFVLRFDERGQCTSFTEWYMKVPS
ncbi:MAG TPA: nuclear transport factor 2 family protein [Chloroflexota bacterium]|jgi:hypothetical protein|nr:nuclear transport factor 2 family protein [Chloroflexota bacterium]